MSDICVSIDQGGQSSRVIAFDDDGRQLADARVPVGTISPAPGMFEQDPDAVVDSIRLSFVEVMRALPQGARVRAGLATQRSSIVCWDRNTGTALSPVISWRDTRNSRWLRSLGLDADFVRRITGLRPSAHYGASKFRWCLDRLPAVSDSSTIR